MATIEQLSTALRNADAAGDVNAARQLAQAIREMQAEPKANAVAPGDDRNSLLGKADAFMRGAADTMTFGLSDELSAGLGALTGIGGKFGDYSGNLERQRATDKADAEDRFGYRLGGQFGGGVVGGVGLAKNGLSLAGNAISRGSGLGRVAAGSAADGAILGAAQGAGSGEGLEGRAKGAVTGLFGGAALGAGAPYVTAAAGALAKPVVSSIMARIRPQEYANAALGESMRRAGSNPERIVAALTDARQDGQPVYSVADALGLSGRRLASTVSRTPHEMRQPFVDFLEGRQNTQGRRITNALTDAFDAPDTAAQRTDLMENLRDQAANANYAAARKEAGAVDISDVIREIDDTLTPGVHKIVSPNNRLANDSIEGALSNFRSRLTDGTSTLTEFNALHRTKFDLDDAIKQAEGRGAGNRAHALARVRDKLDDALAKASAPYARARDVFREDSKAIEAIEQGAAAATRGRSEDTIEAFRGMNPDQQYGWRGGYAGRHIEQVQGSAPGVNKARPLLNDATAAEFPAFAVEGKADALQRQIARENEMFETRRAATGGSATADNIADQADMGQFDPTIVGNLISGQFGKAAMNAVTRALNEVKGLPAPVISKVAQALMETDPKAARALLEAGAARQMTRDGRRAGGIAVLDALGASGTGRLAGP